MAKTKSKSRKKADHTPRIVNRRARHEYHIEERLECGIVLVGSEVKSIRAGKAQLSEGFARVELHGSRLSLWLYNVDIATYDCSTRATGHEPRRSRKLLAHKRQIDSLYGKTQVKGATLVPLEMYFNDRGMVKVSIGLVRGKQKQDKREDVKRREAERDIRRAMTRGRVG